MLLKKISFPSFYLHQSEISFHFDTNGNLYHIEYDYQEKKSYIVKYSSDLELIDRFSFDNVYASYSNIFPSDYICKIFVPNDNNIVLSTKNNKVFVLNSNGEVLNKYISNTPDYEYANHLESLNAQKDNFCCHFFRCNDGKLIVLTNGSPYGTTNERERYILGISKKQYPSFLEKKPFETLYLNDVWKYDLIQNNPENRVFVNNMDLQNYNTTYRLTEAVCSMYEVFRNISQGAYLQSTLWHLQIYQAIDLDENNLFLSVLADGCDKSNKMNKSMPYYFMLLNKHNGNVVKHIQLLDTSVYKTYQILVINDGINKRLIFKSYENIYFLDYEGNIKDQISLVENNIKSFRDWTFLECINGKMYVHNSKKSLVGSIDVGANNNDLINEISKLLIYCKNYIKTI